MDHKLEALARSYAADPSDVNKMRAVANHASRIAGMGTTKKILVCSSRGGGWSTGLSRRDKKSIDFALTHPGLIKAIESEEYLSFGTVMEEFHAECVERGFTVPYGMPDHVVEVNGPYVIHEEEGMEYVLTLDQFLDKATYL